MAGGLCDAATRAHSRSRLAGIASPSLRAAVAANWTLLFSALARRFTPRDPGELRALWAEALALEKACMHRAHATVADRTGVVLGNNPSFRVLYAGAVYRVAAALSERRVTPAEIDLPPEELTPERIAPAMEQLARRRAARVVHHTSVLYTCRAAGCGSKIITVRQYQTRAADEPPTIYYQCQTCGHGWRG